MNKSEYNQIIEKLTEERNELRERKGNDYTRGEEDQFSNFKRIAESLGLTKYQVWAVYAGKHWDAVMNYCKQGQVESEPIEGRIKDLLVYLELFYGMIQEDNQNGDKSFKAGDTAIIIGDSGTVDTWGKHGIKIGQEVELVQWFPQQKTWWTDAKSYVAEIDLKPIEE